MKPYLGHVGESAHVLLVGASVPCRVTAVGEWAGPNRKLTVVVTAKRAAGGYAYVPGNELAVHGASVKPSTVRDTQTPWVWCDGEGHGPRCRDCGDVHTVTLGIPGRAHGGGWVRGGTLTRCSGCGRFLAYVPHKD